MSAPVDERRFWFCSTVTTKPFAAFVVTRRSCAIYSNTQNPLGKIERAKFGDISVYAEAASEPRHVVMYLICSGKSVVQLSAAGERPFAELRLHLDEVAKSLVGSK